MMARAAGSWIWERSRSSSTGDNLYDTGQSLRGIIPQEWQMVNRQAPLPIEMIRNMFVDHGYYAQGRSHAGQMVPIHSQQQYHLRHDIHQQNTQSYHHLQCDPSAVSALPQSLFFRCNAIKIFVRVL